jgi:hypothetical protein
VDSLVQRHADYAEEPPFGEQLEEHYVADPDHVKGIVKKMPLRKVSELPLGEEQVEEYTPQVEKYTPQVEEYTPLGEGEDTRARDKKNVNQRGKEDKNGRERLEEAELREKQKVDQRKGDQGKVEQRKLGDDQNLNEESAPLVRPKSPMGSRPEDRRGSRSPVQSPQSNLELESRETIEL